MTLGRKLCEGAHAVTLAVWLGALVMAAIVVAGVFPMMRELAPTVGTYAAYPSEHHPVIVAGHVGEYVFTALAAVQFTGVLISALTLIAAGWTLGMPVRRVSTMLRACGIGLAAMCVSAQLFWLDPRMNAELRAFWSAAEQGQVDQAERHRAAFQRMHPLASNLLAGSAIGVVLAIGAQVFSLGADARSSRAGGDQPGLEEPRLAGGVV